MTVKNLRIRIFVVSVLLVSAMFAGVVTAYADSFMPPEPFEIWSEDETMVFRWCPGPDENWSHGGTAQAGVYRNGELIYSVENLPTLGTHAGEFLFSADFRHFVFNPQVGQVIALGFFEDGVLLRAYRIDELVRDMNVVTYSVTTASWENWHGRNFDAANNTLTIVTRDDITYVFDITTGEIIYDTAGDTPFIPPAEYSWGFWVNKEDNLPLWARVAIDDTPSYWAQESVESAGELGLLPESFRSGFGRSTTRAEFAALAIALYEHFREPVTRRTTFADTSDPNVEKAAYLGIVSGVDNNRFDPNSPITREQAAVMLSRLVEVLTGQPMGFYLTIRFYDSGDISPWAREGVFKMVSFNIMTGVGEIGRYNRFAPQQPFTREQSIVTLMRIFALINNEVDVTMPLYS